MYWKKNDHPDCKLTRCAFCAPKQRCHVSAGSLLPSQLKLVPNDFVMCSRALQATHVSSGTIEHISGVAAAEITNLKLAGSTIHEILSDKRVATETKLEVILTLLPPGLWLYTYLWSGIMSIGWERMRPIHGWLGGLQAHPDMSRHAMLSNITVICQVDSVAKAIDRFISTTIASIVKKHYASDHRKMLAWETEHITVAWVIDRETIDPTALTPMIVSTRRWLL